MARPTDPTRDRRKTGNRPTAASKAKAAGVVALPTTPGPALPEPPYPLPDAARPMWDRVVAELAPRGLRDADLDGVAMMVLAAHRNREAAAGIASSGLLIRGPRGVMVNPLVKVEKDTAATYMRLAEAFGLTLAARLRLGLMQLAGESILSSLNADLDQRTSIVIQTGS